MMAAPAESSGKENFEYKAFESLFADLTTVLEPSIDIFASKLWSEEIIPKNVYQTIFNKNYDGSNKRTALFLWYVITRVHYAEKQDPKHVKAKEMIRELSEIVKRDKALEDVANEIGKCESSEELQAKQDDLAPVLELSIETIATRAFSNFLITEDEYESVTDPAANHTRRVTNTIFKLLLRRIQNDPKVFQEVKGVLIKMDKPISDFALELETALQKVKEQVQGIKTQHVRN